MKKLPRVTSLAIIGAIVLGAVGSVFAEWAPIATSDCTNFGSDIYSTDGDVVTTKKWNDVVCILKKVYEGLADWPVGRNYTLAFKENPANANRMLATELNLPSSSAFVNGFNGYAGAIHFKDPALSYHDIAGYKASIQYNEITKTIDIMNPNGLKLTTDGRTGISYLVGWEKISVTDTSPFDPNCQYRALTNDGHLLSPFVMTNAALQFYGDNRDSITTIGNPTAMLILYNQKSVLLHKSGGTGYGVSIVSIDKLCLPNFNSNDL